MKDTMLEMLEGFLRAHKFNRLWRMLVSCLAVAVLLVTSYALSREAITMGDSAPEAGQEEQMQEETAPVAVALDMAEPEQAHIEDAPAATEGEPTPSEKVIALIDTLPTREEIEKTLTAFDKAGDDDGYDDYLMEIVTKTSQAYEAWFSLTEEQQAMVTNADKLMELEPFWSMQTLAEIGPLTDDSAYVESIEIVSISDGTTPFDENDAAGNDSSDTNRIVRTFDAVTYNFSVSMGIYENTPYSETRVKLEFVLPLTADQATFDQGAMAWMDQTAGYEPKLTTESRAINDVPTTCQVLTCYIHLVPSETITSVVPGVFGQPVVINVKSMKNGDTFAPIFSACMEYGTWEGNCTTHNREEKATVTADPVTVSAAPKYNIRIAGVSSYKSTFDFSTGNSMAQAYGDGYNKGNVTGRVAKYGIVVQLYNDNASKGLKGIELPEGDITFDLKVSSQYTINDPNNTGYHQGDKIDTTTTYLPLLWSCDGNEWTDPGSANRDGRLLYDGSGSAYNLAPYNSGGGSNACYNGGTWTATQNGDTIHVTVSGYQINIDSMPTTQGDTTHGNDGYYGVDLGIGCFSAGELWLVQPYNKIGSTSDNAGPEFDVVTDYGEGKFDTSVRVINMKATTISGAKLEDSAGTNNAQMKTNDDYASAGVELVLPGVLINRVSYANPTNYNKGVGVENYRDGLDFATPGTEIRLLGGFSYTHRNEPDNQLYWGTNLTKFYGSAIELTDTAPNQIYTGGAQPKEWMVYYATKPDGTDWKDDNELLTTYEDDLVFYNSPSKIPSGHLCVGLLFCFKEDTFSTSIGDPYFFIQQPARVRDDMDLSGKTYIIVSTSRVWSKSMFEQVGMTLDEIPDWTNPNTKLSSFPSGYYESGNTAGSTWYEKTDYSQAASGIVVDHNSDWRHWGDTLLVIGYKTGITKTLCQTSDNTAKTNYNLDAEQRVVDFKLQPRTYYDQGNSNSSLTTTVTIVDTLPEHLTYVPGSSYFGGTYTQTSDNGGTQGKITGGTLREPDSVVKNADGTQTLTWIINDVTVGEAMPAVYYSAYVGDRNPANDVSPGTTSLLNKVRIMAAYDLRQPTIENGNYAEVGISAVRGAASSYGKYSKQNVVDIDGQIDYVVYYDNNGATALDNQSLADAMPVNNVSGSNFTGTYKITSFKISLQGTDTLASIGAKLTYTTDLAYAGKTLDELKTDSSVDSWPSISIGEDGTVVWPEGVVPVLWVLNCNKIPGNTEVRVEYTLQLIPEAGSTLDNIKYVNQLNTSTTITQTLAVRRTLEGLTWLDSNRNGIQDTGEALISGVKVTLLKLSETEIGGTTFNTNGTSGDLNLTLKNTMYSGLTAQTLSQIRVVASIPAGTVMQLYYATGSDGLQESHSIKLDAQTGFYTYTFDLAGKSGWTGDIHALRLDLFQGKNLSGTLRSITLVQSNGDEKVFDFKVENRYNELLTLGNCSFDSYYMEGNYEEIASVETGKQISVLGAAAVDYEKGRYKFTDLSSGTYAVRFTSGTQDISWLFATEPNVGDNDMLDSDGFPTYGDILLDNTVIEGIDMPKAEDMSVALFESKYHDSGFYYCYELPETGGTGTQPYTVCGLTVLAVGILFGYGAVRKRRKAAGLKS